MSPYHTISKQLHTYAKRIRASVSTKSSPPPPYWDKYHFEDEEFYSDINPEETVVQSSRGFLTEEILEMATLDFPQKPEAYLELGQRAMQRGDHPKALAHYQAMQRNITGNPQSYKGMIKALLALGEYQDAESICQALGARFPETPLRYKEKLDLLRILIESNRFLTLSSADFEKMSFVKSLVQNDFNFIFHVSRLMNDRLHHGYVSLANAYVSERGGTFLYVTADQAVMVRNKSAFEKELMALEYGKSQNPGRINWLRSCPPHVERMHASLPQFSRSYIENIFSAPPLIIKGMRVVEADFESAWVNVRNNRRLTTDAPDSWDNTIHIVGASEVYGFGSEDRHTFASFLQKKLLGNHPANRYRVENHGMRGAPMPLSINNLFQIRIHPGDIVILYGYPKIVPGTKCERQLDTLHIGFSRPHDDGEIFFDHDHVGWTGNRRIAERVYEHLFNGQPRSLEPVAFAYSEDEQTRLKKSIELFKYMLYKRTSIECETGDLKDYLDYIKQFKVKTTGVTGSLLVNCNPLTNGHLHLIEYAARQVDHLYLFVIEEDAFHFPFKDRIRIVRNGTRHISNITVLRSGRYGCSKITYPEYFSKEDSSTHVADASMEVWFFCEHMAKVMGVSKTFGAHEPYCQVTGNYNQTMFEIIPQYGIKVEMIPRMEHEGQVISASGVRKLLEKRDFDAIKQIVPPATYEYLQKHYR